MNQSDLEALTASLDNVSRPAALRYTLAPDDLAGVR
jgi:hypothetical protein